MSFPFIVCRQSEVCNHNRNKIISLLFLKKPWTMWTLNQRDQIFRWFYTLIYFFNFKLYTSLVQRYDIQLSNLFSWLLVRLTSLLDEIVVRDLTWLEIKIQNIYTQICVCYLFAKISFEFPDFYIPHSVSGRYFF